MSISRTYRDGGGYYASCRSRRSKIDWAGVGPGDAFKNNLEYHIRMPAQRQFYQLAHKVQRAVAEHTGAAPEAYELKVKPQLSPLMTSYPSTLAAHAAIGHTAFLEFEARVPEKLLFTQLAKYLEDPAECDDVRVDPNSYKEVAKVITKQVQVRLLLEDLARYPFGISVEIYRLFSASQQHDKFRSVAGMLQAVILYGDILPDWREQDLHPMTRIILGDLTRTCMPFFDKLPHTPPQGLVHLGADWVRALCLCLAPYLPEPESEGVSQESVPVEPDEEGYRFKKEKGRGQPTERLAPLNGPAAPTLFDPVNPEQALKTMVGGTIDGKPAEADPLQQLIKDFADAVSKAGGQQQQWEDMRSDVLEHMLKSGGFCESPIQGNPVEGHEVSVRLGKDEVAGGEIFDRPVELSENDQAHAELLQRCAPLVQALKKNLYPNVKQIPETERLRTSGSLDANRLPVADYSQVIFRRYRIREKADPRGKPVVLIACDGSGSLNHKQMQMLKLLAAAWLESTAKSEIQVLAGLYHSGAIRPGVSGPLVQWLYHPQKTPALTRKEATRALVALPPSGTGAQADALSLAFMLEEARQLARGRMIYLILLSDCAWNMSFRTRKTGKEEVYAFFETAYQDHPGKLNTTLVALGVAGATGFEALLDKVVVVNEEQLLDPAAVAGRIGTYVASCLKERRRWVKKQ
jgi:hypothetical protein